MWLGRCCVVGVVVDRPPTTELATGVPVRRRDPPVCAAESMVTQLAERQLQCGGVGAECC